ncbi:MAG: homoserine kinase [Chitinophagales bacterium]|nr:homoserine kinase [Chitinophagales bacterium]
MKRKDNWKKAFAPASIGNLTVGFDIIGMAIEQPGDIVHACFNNQKCVRVLSISGDGGKLPLPAHENTAGVAVLKLLEKLNTEQGIDLKIEKKMPLGSGMGSSAASAVAAVVAANALFENPLPKSELIDCTLAAEATAVGTAHGDNVFPSLLGGIVLIHTYNPLRIIQLPVPENLQYVLVHPHLELLTAYARSVVPKQVDLATAIAQNAHTATFVHALHTQDYNLLQQSMFDTLAEPHRKQFIPGYELIQKAALAKGAINCGISGAGPSMYALGKPTTNMQKIGEAIQAVWQRKGIGSEMYLGKVNTQGAHLLD